MRREKINMLTLQGEDKLVYLLNGYSLGETGPFNEPKFLQTARERYQQIIGLVGCVRRASP